MQLYFNIRAFIIVFIVCNITPSQAISRCSTPSKYGSFQALVSETCTAEQHQWAFQQSTCKECMYVDSQGRKVIGVDFNLEETNAKAILATVGADYDNIVKGAATDIKTPCDCKAVVCLNQSQIEGIFEESIAKAIATAKLALPALFGSLCCMARMVVVDIAFALGNSTFSTYKPLFSWLKYQNWKAASDYLRTTKWCLDEASTRCATDADELQYPGCPCSGRFPKKCYEIVSSCCQKGQSCCNASVTINNHIHQELLCCKFPNAVCCEATKNKCCPGEYPTCCLPNYCCGLNDLCGSDGRCYTPSGMPGHSVAAESLILPKGT